MAVGAATATAIVYNMLKNGDDAKEDSYVKAVDTILSS